MFIEYQKIAFTNQRDPTEERNLNDMVTFLNYGVHSDVVCN